MYIVQRFTLFILSSRIYVRDILFLSEIDTWIAKYPCEKKKIKRLHINVYTYNNISFSKSD